MNGKFKKKLNLLFRILLLYIPLVFFLCSIIGIITYKYIPVSKTPLMLLRSFEHKKDTSYQTRQTWIPLNDISFFVSMATMASEDIRFQVHNGFDWESINKSIKAYKRGGKLIGSSTISQQTAKNVFLWPKRSWIRKGLEAYFVFWMESIWGKERIMEVYLNVIEMGQGIYGVEAASRYYFQKSASELDQKEAILLVACFPAPLHRSPLQPTVGMEERAKVIERIMILLPIPVWLQQQESENEK